MVALMTEGRKKKFGGALAAARKAAGFSQTQLAAAVGLTQGAVSGWEAGTHEPEPGIVFACEKRLKLPPGTLSALLGYVPVGKTKGTGLETLLLSEQSLTEAERQALLVMYRSLRGSRKPA